MQTLSAPRQRATSLQQAHLRRALPLDIDEGGHLTGGCTAKTPEHLKPLQTFSRVPEDLLLLQFPLALQSGLEQLRAATC